PHVEDARDRLVAMNRSVPEPTPAAVAENDAEVRSEQPLTFTDRFMDVVKRGPTVVEATHVGEPSLDDPKRVLAPEVSKENFTMLREAANVGKPVVPEQPATPTGVNEPPRSDQPSNAPLQMQTPGEGTGVGVEVVAAPNGAPPADPNALVKTVGPADTVVPAVEKAEAAPLQQNDIKPGENPSQGSDVTNGKAKKPKVNLGEESSSKKKKKKGLAKINPF
ncbi:MAG TPA: hypothetical protein VMI31_03935, partial [Fimbriimonadaceae bacterium]|nr:hypothetical protein [Fimbriimonadaceae bacterium]